MCRARPCYVGSRCRHGWRADMQLQHAPTCAGGPSPHRLTINKRTEDAVGCNHSARELALLRLVRLRKPLVNLNAMYDYVV